MGFNSGFKGLITDHILSLHHSAVVLLSKDKSMTSFRASVLLKSTTQNFNVDI